MYVCMCVRKIITDDLSTPSRIIIVHEKQKNVLTVWSLVERKGKYMGNEMGGGWFR